MMPDIAPYMRRVHYYETDQMAIVHHSNYIRYMEEARLEYMRRAGLEYTRLEAEGILMPVTGITCSYHSPVQFDQWMEIVTTLVVFDGIRAAYTYEIYTAQDHILAVTGRSEHCFLQQQSRRPVSLKKADPACYAAWCALLERVQHTAKE